MFSSKPKTVSAVCKAATADLEVILNEQVAIGAAAVDAQDKLDAEYAAKTAKNEAKGAAAEAEAKQAGVAIDNFKALFGVKDEALNVDERHEADSQ